MCLTVHCIVYLEIACNVCYTINKDQSINQSINQHCNQRQFFILPSHPSDNHISAQTLSNGGEGVMYRHYLKQCAKTAFSKRSKLSRSCTIFSATIIVKQDQNHSYTVNMRMSIGR